ncbi:hypothetical protein AAC387_Pa10g0275 [Persea americana]
MSFLVQDYCHSCQQKYIAKGKQLLGAETETQSKGNVMEEGPVANNNDTWISVQPRGQGQRWYRGANINQPNLTNHRLGTQRRYMPATSKKGNHMTSSQSLGTGLLLYKRTP